MGLRLPHQMADGTFTANKSATVTVDAELLRRLLLDHNERANLFPDVATELRSGPTSKTIRLSIGPGIVRISLEERGGSRTKVVVEHEGLPQLADVQEWKFYWSDWLDAIDETSEA